MKKTTMFFPVVLFLFLLSNVIIAQDAASVVWPCTDASRVDLNEATSPSVAVTVGNVNGANEASGSVDWRIRSYSGTANGSGAYQRWWPNDGANPISWGPETTEVADRYVEFSLSPNSGFNFSVDSIDIDLLGGGTGSIRANIYYSTDNFASKSQLNPEDPADGIALGNSGSSDIMHFVYTPALQVNDGETLSLRVYPWYEGSASTSKYLYTSDVGVFGTTSETPVPVELTSFSASVNKKTVELKWSTATEVDNNGFEIERSSNQATWKKIGFLKGSGTTTRTSTYSYKDVSALNGKLYYRLKQVDFNGTFKYSKVVEVNYGVPSKFNLAQNYPNPFNPSTSIKFDVPEAAFVNLTIYNVLGAEIASLVNEKLEPGAYTKNFNASGLTSGIYFYRLTAGNLVITKKMSLLK